MAFHSKKDFSALCGLKTKELAVYIKRNKVILSGDYIDDSIQINADFLLKYRNRKQMRSVPISNGPPPVETAPSSPNIQDPDHETEDIDITQDVKITGDLKSMANLNKKKLIVEIRKKEREIALLKLREEKLNAIVIPTELVKTIFGQHSKSMGTQFKNAIDSIITKIAKKKDLTLNEVAELRSELLATINNALDKSVAESKKNISNIVKEFVEKREIGESR